MVHPVAASVRQPLARPALEETAAVTERKRDRSVQDLAKELERAEPGTIITYQLPKGAEAGEEDPA